MLALNALRRTFDFRGRSSRAEYWQFLGFAAAGGLATITTDMMISRNGIPMFFAILVTVLTVPAYTVTIRRLHDRNRSGWWIAAIWGLNFFGAFLMGFYNQVQFTVMGPIARVLWYGVSFVQVGAAIFLIYQLALAGDEGVNRFGPPPSDEPLQGGLNFGQAGDLAKDVIAKVGGADPLTQIERLAKLREQGVLTETEFDAQKAALLKRL